MTNLSNPKTQMDKPNADTEAALMEVKRMLSDPNTPKYNVEDALKELKA